MLRLDQTKALSYLCNKAKEFFDSNGYTEGIYNDNRFVEGCYKIYLGCVNEAGQDEDSSLSLDETFDIQDFDNVLWVYGYNELASKLTEYYDDISKHYMPSEDEFCQKAIEYIDWAFSIELYSCEWHPEKYLDVVDYIPNINHQKWLKNEITDWWEKNKDMDLKAIYDEDKKLTLADDPDVSYINLLGHEMCNFFDDSGPEDIQINKSERKEIANKLGELINDDII